MMETYRNVERGDVVAPMRTVPQSTPRYTDGLSNFIDIYRFLTYFKIYIIFSV